MGTAGATSLSREYPAWPMTLHRLEFCRVLRIAWGNKEGQNFHPNHPAILYGQRRLGVGGTTLGERNLFVPGLNLVPLGA